MEIMENLEWIISLAGTAFALLTAVITFVAKWVKAVKAKVKTDGLTALLDAVAPIIKTAETLTNFSGAEKKEFVMTKANQFAIERGIGFDVDAVSDKIEQLVELSRQVNKREPKKELLK